MPPLNEEEATTVGGGGRRGSESELGPEAMVSLSLSLSLQNSKENFKLTILVVVFTYNCKILFCLFMKERKITKNVCHQ